MQYILNPESNILAFMQSDDVSFSVTLSGVSVRDHAEGRSVYLDMAQVKAAVVESLEYCDNIPKTPQDAEYNNILASNIIANANPAGLAYFVLQYTDV